MENDGHQDSDGSADEAGLRRLQERLAMLRSVLAGVEANRGIGWLPLKWVLRLFLGRAIRDVQTQLDLREGTLVAFEGRTEVLRFGRRKS